MEYGWERRDRDGRVSSHCVVRTLRSDGDDCEDVVGVINYSTNASTAAIAATASGGLVLLLLLGREPKGKIWDANEGWE